MSSTHRQSISGGISNGDPGSFGEDDSPKLIIMDRGMDLKTPLMHDLTFLVCIIYVSNEIES